MLKESKIVLSQEQKNTALEFVVGMLSDQVISEIAQYVDEQNLEDNECDSFIEEIALNVWHYLKDNHFPDLPKDQCD